MSCVTLLDGDSLFDLSAAEAQKKGKRTFVISPAGGGGGCVLNVNVWIHFSMEQRRR